MPKFIMAMVMASLLFSACQKKDPLALAEEARQLQAEGKYSEARVKIDESLKIRKTAEALKELGNVFLLHENNLDEAEKYYQQALELKPDYTNALHNLGLVALKRYEKEQEEKPPASQENLAKAKSRFEQALALDPDFQLSHQEMAKVHAYQKNFAAALAEIQKAIRLNPNSAQVYSIEGQVHFGQQDYQSALESFKKALALSGQDSNTLYFLAQTHKMLKNQTEAELFYQRYLQTLKSGQATAEEIERAEKLAPEFMKP